MTTGEGIIWSAVVLVTFASIVLIAKNKRWGPFFKVLAIVVALGAVIGTGIWLYSKYDSRPRVMSSLNGISLGMSEVDVTLKKGEPWKISELPPTPDGFGKFLAYDGYSDSFTVVTLRGPRDSMVVTDVCDVGAYGRVLGFSKYSSEKDVLKKLGEPSNVSISEKGTEKILSYPEWNAAFTLAKGNVIEVCVTSRPQKRYSVEYGESSETEDGK